MIILARVIVHIENSIKYLAASKVICVSVTCLNDHSFGFGLELSCWYLSDSLGPAVMSSYTCLHG